MVGPQLLTVEFDGEMSEYNTAGWANPTPIAPRHAFSIFANPLLGPDRPDPDDPDVHRGLAGALKALGCKDEAAAHGARARELRERG